MNDVQTNFSIWIRKNRFILPSYVTIVLLVIIVRFVSPELTTTRSIISLLTLSTLYAVLGIGQGLVILTGGIDLSIPSTMSFAAIALTSLSLGYDNNLIWVIPVVLSGGLGIGLLNGLGIAFLGISPVIMTMAMNAIIRGIVLVTIHGTPKGYTPPAISYLMSGHLLGYIPPILIFVIFLYIMVTLLLKRTPYGHQIYAVGSDLNVAHLSGINVKGIIISVYAISGLIGAFTGIMLAGYSTLSYVGMGDPYLLPSIAIVVVGGGSILGGRGEPIGTLGGSIMITFLSTILVSLLIPEAVRSIFFGIIILGALLFSREDVRRT